MLQNVPKSQVIDYLKSENPWWISGQIDPFFNELKKRPWFNFFKPLVMQTEINRAVVVMGPRRVGKTVMIHHMIRELIRNGISPASICYISIDTPIYNGISLNDLFSCMQESAGNSKTEGWYVFFDEIQYLRNWEVHLKTMVDHYRKSRFIASGSASAALKLKSMESGAGRFTDFMLPSLTFHEYIDFRGLSHLMRPVEMKIGMRNGQFYKTTHIQKLNEEFINYINCGGYPEVIFSEEIMANPGRYIRHDIVDKVLLRDLPSLYGIRDVQELNSMFTMIAFNTGNEISLEALSKKSGVVKSTLKKYMEYLEAAFLVKIVRRVDQNAKRFQRDTLFKIYLTNPSLRSALFAPISANDDKAGNLIETAIIAQWFHREWFTPRYARWQNGEVDIVALKNSDMRPSWAIEVKWSNRYFENPSQLRSLVKFQQANPEITAMSTTLDKTGVKEVNGKAIHFFPAAEYAYTIGANQRDYESNIGAESSGELFEPFLKFPS